MYAPRYQYIELCLRANRSHQARIPSRGFEKNLGDDQSQQSSETNRHRKGSSSSISIEESVDSSSTTPPQQLVWPGRDNDDDNDEDTNTTAANGIGRWKHRKRKDPQERLSVDIELTY